MNCDLAQRSLSALADGEQPDAEPAGVAAHVAGCAACTAFDATIHRVRALLRDDDLPAVAVRPVRHRARRWVGVAAAAAAAVAAVAYVGVRDGSDQVGTTTPATTFPVTIPEPVAQPALLLAWTQEGMPPAAVEAVRAVPGVTAVAVVRDGRIDLDAGDGWRIPLDAVAIDPAEYSGVEELPSFGPGQALLGETSDRLRGHPDRLQLIDGTELEVAGVVPDTAVGAAEVVVDVATGAALGVDLARAIIVAGTEDRGAVEAAIGAALPGEAVRYRSAGETPYLRAADAVLPQSIVKATYGEFRYRPGEGDEITIDAEWVAANIVNQSGVDGVGGVRCHRLVLDAVVDVLREVGAPNGYDGCFVPRLSRTGGAVSRHAWGIAVDLAFGDGQDPAAIAAFGDAGFTWGGTWLVPDPAHFEAISPPAPAPPPG